jgi:hypothetical protein
MVPGFNTDFKYRGETYHAQTEDNGLANPVVVTLLYHKGAILASRRTSYRELVGSPGLTQELQALMKDQHKAIMRELLAGAFDRNGAAPAVAGASGEDPADAAAAVAAEKPAPAAVPAAVAAAAAAAAPAAAAFAARPAPARAVPAPPPAAPVQPVQPARAAAEPAAALTLDQAIRHFLEDYAAAMAAGHMAQRSR